jgi:hypothetical protein
MKKYEFTLILVEGAELTDDLAEAIFEAGCDDATSWQSEGTVFLGFDRQAASFEDAVRTAIAGVEKAGCTVARVEIEPDAAMLRG